MAVGYIFKRFLTLESKEAYLKVKVSRGRVPCNGFNKECQLSPQTWKESVEWTKEGEANKTWRNGEDEERKRTDMQKYEKVGYPWRNKCQPDLSILTIMTKQCKTQNEKNELTWPMTSSIITKHKFANLTD